MSTPKWRIATALLAIAMSLMSSVSSAEASAAASDPSSGRRTQSTAANVSQPGGTWGPAQSLSGVAAARVVYPAISSVSCSSPGDCGAIGLYSDSSGLHQPFVVNETGGTWRPSAAILGLASLSKGSSQTGQISCPAAGTCTAVGYYYTAGPAGHQGFIVSETGGLWGRVRQVPGIASLTNGKGSSSLLSISCASAGNCSAVGNYDISAPSQQAYVVDETDGIWGNAEQVPGVTSLSGNQWSALTSVSCGSAGSCAAGGVYFNGSVEVAFMVTETDGSWGSAQLVPGLAVLNTAGGSALMSVSCASAGNCSAGGYYQHAVGNGAPLQPFVVTETAGTWGNAEEVPGVATLNTGGHAEITSVSCASAGNCSAGGIYWGLDNAGLSVEPFVVNEIGGTWGTAAQIPGIGSLNTRRNATLNSVSCGSAGNCSAGGSYYSDDVHPYVANETDGTWEAAEEVPGAKILSASADSTVETISCARPGYCSAAGYNYSSSRAFVVNEATASTTTLSLTKANATYGDEQTIRASVTVSSGDGGTPKGTVTISAGSRRLCATTLTSGAASCALQATDLSVGTYRLKASYGGDSTFVASESPTSTLTVSKARSRTRLSLSKSKVTYGHEAAERLSVAVFAQYMGVPSGKVVVTAGKATICAIKLRSGRGSCVLRPRQLKVGTHRLRAVYAGSRDFAGSSAQKTVTVETQRNWKNSLPPAAPRRGAVAAAKATASPLDLIKHLIVNPRPAILVLTCHPIPRSASGQWRPQWVTG